MTVRLRRLWIAGAVLLAFGTLVPGPGSVALLGAVPLAVAAGMTAARGRAVGAGLLVVAWVVALGPVLAVAGTVAWWWFANADMLAVFLLAWIGGSLAAAFCTVFCVAYIAEAIRLRRAERRGFVAPRPAWENDPTPPSYS